MLKKCKEVDKDYFSNHPVLTHHTSLLEKVKNTFSPQDNIFFLKAPGRVNLIGEHTDYNMGPVLPCAINKEIIFCIRPGKTSKINVLNVDKKFDDINFSIREKIEPYPTGHWGNYIKAGILGILDYVKSSSPKDINRFKGYDIIVSSTLPPAAGISSSSALVVAAALSFVLANNLDLSKPKIAEICAKAEHFVGTSGGGMDQAASLLAKKNSFLYMEFNPLRIEEIMAPEGIQLLLFSSLVQAEKSGKSRLEYNRRVLECKMAVDLFKRFLLTNVSGSYPEINFIGEVKSENFNISQDKLDQLVELFLNDLPDSFTIAKFTEKMSLNEQELNKRYQSILQGSDRLKEPSDGFKIKSRFKHVYYECRRVYKTIDSLRLFDLNELGNLLNKSHNSLSLDYEVSIPEADELVNILRENGALGARIMGAGFGGMILALTDPATMDQLAEAVKKKYYFNKIPENQNEHIIPCVTADGAGLL